MQHAWERTAYRVLVGKPEGKRPLGRLAYIWEDNIKVDPFPHTPSWHNA
jgi:hypothetical protein